MCGIILLRGPEAQSRLPQILAKMQHRGPDSQHCWSSENGKLAIGFSRLAINDTSENGSQPYHHINLVGAFNGEIYNFKNLIKEFGLPPDIECDTHVVLPIYAKISHEVLTKLDGFYSGVIYKKNTETAILFRDHIGKKPLFYGVSGTEIFVSSELKVFDEISWFEHVPLGISRLDFKSASLSHRRKHKLVKLQRGNTLVAALTQAVAKRLPATEQPTGLFLSGGLDSSIIAAISQHMRNDIVYFALGNNGSTDIQMVQLLADHLNLQHVRYIPLPTPGQMSDLIRKIVRATESYNPSIVSNGLATYLLAAAASSEGIKVVITGEGADELFAGYHQYLPEREWRVMQTALLNDMHFTELRRLDLCSMAHSVEARCPFLDKKVREIAQNMPFKDYYSAGTNKSALRNLFADLLPAQIALRPKTSFDVGSGIRAMVINHLSKSGKSEKEALRDIWLQEFNFCPEHTYFHRYPVFDEAISKRGAKHR
ncbi:asparagine synthetase B family protein [Arsukibacterium ikkense]|uniref:asparagine synthetase B family protein n=1 Tax=Arsukibacterium ikkense TaxID=336831 RepID=UPI00069B3B11|nr:asparagine synthase-related protein [Arsukibacterium ikkense]